MGWAISSSYSTLMRVVIPATRMDLAIGAAPGSRGVSHDVIAKQYGDFRARMK